MASDPWGFLLLFVVFLIAGAVVRAAEVAAQSVDEADLEADSPAARLAALRHNRFGGLDAAFVLLMLGAMASAAFAMDAPLRAALAGTGALCGVLSWAIAFVGAGLLCVGLAALLPAYVASNAPEKALRRTARTAWALATLFKPLLLISQGLAALLLRPFHLRPVAPSERVTEQEIRMMVDIGEEKGEIEADEKQMIENIFEFNNTTAQNCMVHRKDVTGIDVEDAPEEVLRTIQDSGLSRFPVYEEDIDNIVGILTSRDYLLNDCFKRGKTLRELIRPAYFVPETTRADLLFSQMQQRKQHMAIVVDEYGGTSGLVTMEDLLEEIVGNIYDEFDPQDDEEILPLGENRYRVSGSAQLDALCEKLGVEVDAGEDCDTLGGLVFSHLAEIPSDGERPVVTCMGLRISVEQILDRRVEWAIVEKIPPERPEPMPPAGKAKT